MRSDKSRRNKRSRVGEIGAKRKGPCRNGMALCLIIAADHLTNLALSHRKSRFGQGIPPDSTAGFKAQVVHIALT